MTINDLYSLKLPLDSATFDEQPRRTGVQGTVVQRKIVGTLQNEKGVRIYETLPKLLATWEQKGLNLQEALSTALTEAWQNNAS